MAIPRFDQMLRPILALAAEGPISRRLMVEAMTRHLGLTPEELEARLPSGVDTVVSNRAGWAMTHLTKAILIEKIAPKTYRATERGHAFLVEHPSAITQSDLRTFPEYQAFAGAPKHHDASEATTATTESDSAVGTMTPQEVLDDAMTSLNSDLRGRLLEAILKQTPTFFEHLVLDVLVAMGYGGSRADAAQHLGKSGDEG